MAVIRYEFRQIQRLVFWWTVAIALLSVTMLPTYLGFMTGVNPIDLEILTGFMDNKFLAALGLSVEFLAQPIGMFSFLNAWIFSLALCGNSMYLGLSLHTKEYTMKTADFLMTKSLSRGKIYWSKLAVGLLEGIYLNTVYLCLAFLVMNAKTAGDFDLRTFWLAGCSIYLLQFIYLAIGVFLGTIAPRNRHPLQTTVGFVFLTVTIGTFANVMSSTLLTYLSPPKYFVASEIFLSGSYELKYLIFLLVVSAVLVIVSYHIYCKKDVITVS